MAGTLVANTINTDTGLFSTNNAYFGIAKAWVQFTGSTATINASFNVSSITRASTGYYTVNFTTALASANYAVTAQVGTNGTQSPYSQLFCNPVSSNTQVTPTTTSFVFSTTNPGQTSNQEGGLCNVIVCGA